MVFVKLTLKAWERPGDEASKPTVIYILELFSVRIVLRKLLFKPKSEIHLHIIIVTFVTIAGITFQNSLAIDIDIYQSMINACSKASWTWKSNPELYSISCSALLVGFIKLFTFFCKPQTTTPLQNLLWQVYIYILAVLSPLWSDQVMTNCFLLSVN